MSQFIPKINIITHLSVTSHGPEFTDNGIIASAKGLQVKICFLLYIGYVECYNEAVTVKVTFTLWKKGISALYTWVYQHIQYSLMTLGKFFRGNFRPYRLYKIPSLFSYNFCSIHVCMYAFIHVCMYVCMYIHVYVWMDGCIYLPICLSKCVWLSFSLLGSKLP